MNNQPTNTKTKGIKKGLKAVKFVDQLFHDLDGSITGYKNSVFSLKKYGVVSADGSYLDMDGTGRPSTWSAKSTTKIIADTIIQDHPTHPIYWVKPAMVKV